MNAIMDADEQLTICLIKNILTCYCKIDLSLTLQIRAVVCCTSGVATYLVSRWSLECLHKRRGAQAAVL
jgi:hypothetical protein